MISKQVFQYQSDLFILKFQSHLSVAADNAGITGKPEVASYSDLPDGNFKAAVRFVKGDLPRQKAAL